VRDAASEAALTVVEPSEANQASRRREALLREYGEVASNFRLLTDIRFKLLAFLPIAAAAAAALRGAGAADTTTAVTTLGLSLFGLIVTLGLVSYNARNDQLYNELVGRAAYIERSIDLPDGAFANRPTSWLSISLPLGRRWPVEHGSSVALIYGASVALWAFMSFYSIAQLGYRGKEPNGWVLGGVLLLAIAVTLIAARLLGKQRRARSEDMRVAAELAVKLAEGDLQTAAASPAFRVLCAGLRDKQVAASEEFRNLVRGPAQTRASSMRTWLAAVRVWLGALGTSTSNDKAGKAVEKIRKQAEFYADLETAGRTHYGLETTTEASPSQEAYFVALLTDLPPRWIDDVGTGRR
jgi:hypothetical protein